MTRDTGALGSLLLEEGVISEARLNEGLALSAETERPLGRVLVEEGLVDERDLVRALAKHIGVEYVNLADVTIDPAAASMIPESLARRYVAIPFAFEGEKLVVALSDPANVLAIDDIRAISGRDIVARVAAKTDVEEALQSIAGLDESVSDLADLVETEDVATQDLSAVEASTEEAPIVKLVNMLITKATADRASDIHVEPTDKDLRVRFRIDGVLHEVMRTPRTVAAAVTSRLKIMADMDIAERRRPQDGRISVRVGSRSIDLRVSALPTIYGEKVVMRILDNSTAMLELTDLGFEEDTLARYATSYNKPYGCILVTGPTGSGKSTTLYSTLNVLNNPDVNIVTVEDPVEYRLTGISQVQVNKKAGLTFANALRSFLRQDPDIMLVGEIRDKETGNIAIESALTGHLVLSTLHTNDAPSTVSRLTEMGIEAFLVGSAVDSVLGQRLARRLCSNCKVPYDATVEELTHAGWDFELLGGELPGLFRPEGCNQCSNTGYRGRLAMHEIMIVSEEIERLVVQHAPTDQIASLAIEQGMRTMRQDGLIKASRGLTSLEEVLRVTV